MLAEFYGSGPTGVDPDDTSRSEDINHMVKNYMIEAPIDKDDDSGSSAGVRDLTGEDSEDDSDEDIEVDEESDDDDSIEMQEILQDDRLPSANQTQEDGPTPIEDEDDDEDEVQENMDPGNIQPRRSARGGVQRNVTNISSTSGQTYDNPQHHQLELIHNISHADAEVKHYDECDAQIIALVIEYLRDVASGANEVAFSAQHLLHKA